ncbi:MAG TPA: M4 family metallopeptidase, partial [Thermoanaerobaculia bacterium]|nr:M4 family metallopeptidase [Thermoanaerobaculia bacterium]
MASSSNAEVREAAHHAMEVSAAMRGKRTAIGPFAGLLAASPGVKRRTVYDEKGGSKLPGKLIRSEGGKPSSDKSVNEAYDYAGDTYDFYSAVFARNSVDNKGMRLDSSVHYNKRFNNAFWDGTQMVYGDGDGVIFSHFTSCIDVIGHELTHGVTQFTSALEYEAQSGALNKHFSDVMGSLVKQWKLKQTAAQADWLIGKGLLGPSVKGIALRSMKAPGTAVRKLDGARRERDVRPQHDATVNDEDRDRRHERPARLLHRHRAHCFSRSRIFSCTPSNEPEDMTRMTSSGCASRATTSAMASTSSICSARTPSA